jgi:hypothetical protein
MTLGAFCCHLANRTEAATDALQWVLRVIAHWFYKDNPQCMGTVHVRAKTRWPDDSEAVSVGELSCEIMNTGYSIFLCII